MQNLINEQLTIYGIEVYYLPRKVFKTDNIIKEVQSSKFDDSFLIEAYLNNYEGYNPDSDLMTKFGLKLTNEVSLTISRERYEEFIAPFLEGISSGIRDGIITDYTLEDLITRPKEGDLVYFPLGERLFEIKKVESEKPFYQLNTNYIYELRCELYEYENELIDTNIDEVDSTVDDEYLTTINLVGLGLTASGTAVIGGSGMIGFIDLINDGSGYVSAPTVQISPPSSGNQATAVAITTSKSGVKSIKEILVTNPGAGYDAANPPLVMLTGGGGVGAAVTVGVVDNGISGLTLTQPGVGYAVEPTITFTGSTGSGGTPTIARTVVKDGSITDVQFSNTGSKYESAPTVTFSGISTTGIGTFTFNEIVTAEISGVTARVKDFKRRTDLSSTNPPIELRVSLNSGEFHAGDVLVGSISSARYIVDSYDNDSFDDQYDSNADIETEADNLIDFTEGNPFGDY